MKCQEGTCEHNAYQTTLKNLRTENAALFKELEAVKANMGILEIYHKNINQIKSDAVLGFISAVNGAVENDFITDREVEEMDLNDFILLAEKYASSLINKKG